MISLSARSESFPIEGSFTISRGSKTKVDVVVVELSDGKHTGRGECVPYARYGESIDSVIELIMSLEDDIKNGLDRGALQTKLESGAARNALDCAFWDLEAKQKNTRAWNIAGIADMQNLTTAYTLSLETPEKMRESAAKNADRPLLKLKLGGEGDIQRVQAVRLGAPNSRLIVDANEGWTAETYQELVPKLHELGVEMIEQPFPAGDDEILKTLDRPIALCADESCHDRESLKDIIGKYDMINIKLDKTGGLTEAFALKEEAEANGLTIMVGCMLATSLAMAPAILVAQNTAIVDLDGPLLLAKDRENPLRFDKSELYPPEPELWG
ncbi:dipeptide epimerase [Cocleimonas flava]|uniref:Dipeptide epimerase n=1 Tax=Cocleimonas flava TaxID=634765 RepID=A0A4R1F2A6_9GAMM|nr:N-acetyl-D-Glu racemase DgcA [Cocleimonas flava]TCJ84471.1 L-alanine-DL-glutamate epimerase-like enolase superfamily enzyme [Cocleimonas flava]